MSCWFLELLSFQSCFSAKNYVMKCLFKKKNLRNCRLYTILYCYIAITPRLPHVAGDPATVPGLSLSSRDHGNTLVPDSMPSVRKSNEVFPDVHSQETASQPASHHPYIENRVLTPSRYRKPSQTRSDPNSPRREFATQTGEFKC